jgi:hypothetical protein
MLVVGSGMLVMMMGRPGGFWPRKRGGVAYRSLMEDTGNGSA